tara:strand:- start:18370 stop:18711 length:342 start_codon:yes stop_codon:yes gene_type:complete
MATPSDAAASLFLGTGIGCFLITGFGLFEGRMSLDEASIGWAFPVLGAVMIGLSNAVRSSGGFLSTAFPKEDEAALESRVQADIEASVKDASVGSAWARLEADVLATDLGQEE